MNDKTASIYQIKITLQGIEPPIWRRLLVPGTTTLSKLHRIIQTTMGWYDYHLHLFTIHGQNYTAPLPGDPGHLIELRAKSANRVKLSSLISAAGETLIYEYDFGDSWEHHIEIEKILPHDPAFTLPACIEGARACPPEDVGGVRRYAHFLEAIQNPRHPEHGMYRAWIGGGFDPEAFDLDAVNKRLKTIR